MKKTIATTLQTLLLVPVFALAFGIAVPSGDVSASSIQDGVNASQGDDVPTEITGTGGVFTTIVNILLFIIGAVSVIMLVIGGIRYTISNGDSGAISSAKNTILYSIIGLVVALLAYALVNWVLSYFVGGGGGTEL